MADLAMLAIVAFALASFLPQGARAEGSSRVALVMVAEDYQKLPKSSVGMKRAGDVVEGLQARGFEVIQVANPPNSRALAALVGFSSKVAGADVALAVLIGHTTAAGGQSYFLPVNIELGASTDLFSRGISVTSVAQMVSRAKAGAVFVLMTQPSFATPVAGLDARPEFAAEVPRNVVAVFSSSARVPVSRVDAAGEQAADSLAKALQQTAPTLADLAKAASAEAGAVFGTPPDVSLGKPAPVQSAPVAAQPVASPSKPPEPDAKQLQEAAAKAEAERNRARDEKARADAAQTEVAKAQAEADRARAEAARAQAEAEKAKAEARQAEAQAALAKAQAEASRTGSQVATAVAPVDEKDIGQKQRQRIQERLRELKLYTGPIDSILGPLTREAIMGFQRNRHEAVTGYLTPEQFQALLPDGT